MSPGLRKLRGIETAMTSPAILKDYRLTFAVGGGANIVPKRGYEVHGVLMELKTQKDWDTLEAFEVSYDFTLVDVYTYGEEKCYQARAFVMDGDEFGNEHLPTDKLPQERFLRIIATGMRHHGIDEDYIENEVMNCPYIPMRKPSEYLRFPDAAKIKSIPESKYLKHADARNWFAVGRRVFYVPERDEKNKMVQWLNKSYFGKLDVTWSVSRTLYDPDLPECSCIEELTDLHHAWCENMLVDYFAQSELKGTVMVGLLTKDEGNRGCKIAGLVKKLKTRRGSHQAQEILSTRSQRRGSKFLEPFISDSTSITCSSSAPLTQRELSPDQTQLQSRR